MGTLQTKYKFTVVQIAHRLETLTNSDCLYFLKNGKVVESIVTDDRSAIATLRQKKVKFRIYENPLTGEKMQQVSEGFFRSMWDVSHGDNELGKMDATALRKKVEELQKQLDEAKHTHEVKAHVQRVKLKMRAVAHLSSARGFHAAASPDDDHKDLNVSSIVTGSMTH